MQRRTTRRSTGSPAGDAPAAPSARVASPARARRRTPARSPRLDAAAAEKVAPRRRATRSPAGRSKPAAPVVASTEPVAHSAPAAAAASPAAVALPAARSSRSSREAALRETPQFILLRSVLLVVIFLVLFTLTQRHLLEPLFQPHRTAAYQEAQQQRIRQQIAERACPKGVECNFDLKQEFKL